VLSNELALSTATISEMAKDMPIPPWGPNVKVYLEPVAQLQQVAEAKSTAYRSDLDTAFRDPADAVRQLWNIDAWDQFKGQFFLHLNSDRTTALTTPEQDGGNAFIDIQGDVHRNGGIQVWVFESVGDPASSVWRLRNLNTNFYLYYQPGTPGLPIIAVSLESPGIYAEWKVVVVE